MPWGFPGSAVVKNLQLSPRATATEARVRRACALQQEKPTHLNEE